MDKQRIGIIDMGSNSVRFVIYDVDRQACYKELMNLKVSARLSTYINENGEMTNEGINVILGTLDKFSNVAQRYDMTEIRCVATAAVRNASNRDRILASIRHHSPFSMAILSEEQEAYYGYLAVTNSTDLQEGITVDIGGGSTEVTYFNNRQLKHSHSFPFGALTLKKQFVSDDRPAKQEWQALRKFLQTEFKSLPWLKNIKAPVVGIGGTARNIALVHQNYVSYPLSGLHQYEMTGREVSSVLNKLSFLPLKKREKVDGLSKDRADIILPAVTAIDELIKYAGTESFTVSNKGLRDGLFYEKLLKTIEVTHFPDVTEESFYQLSIQYDLDEDHHRRMSLLAAYLANTLADEGVIHLYPKDFKHLRWAARVFYIGTTIHHESKSQHTFYLLTNQSIDGLSHMDRLAIAFMSSFKSRSQLNMYASPYRHWLTKENLYKYELLGAVLKLCYALNISQRDVVQEIRLENISGNTLYLTVFYKDDVYFESFHANKYKKHLERVLKKQLQLSFTKAH